MKKFFIAISILFFFAAVTFFITKPYFLQGKVLFPGNLLVSFYEPWKSYAWPGYPNGPANKPIGFDDLRIFYPIRQLTTQALKNWQLPLWNPYYFAGNTLLGTYQSAVFNPVSLLFLFLPSIDAWSIGIILQPFLACIFMYLFLRSLQFSRLSCILGGILFGICGNVIVLMEESFMAVYSAIFLPLILYAITQFVKKQSGWMFFLLCLGLTGSIFSGWFQTTLYVWIFAVFWIVYVTWKNNAWKTMRIAFLSFPLSILTSAIHLFPSFEAFFYSARGTTDAKFVFDTYLVPFYHLITYLAPDFFGNPGAYNYFGAGFYYEKMLYIGIIGIIFALYEFFSGLPKTPYANFFKWSWVITLSLGISLPTSWFVLYYLHLPFISTILPSRVFFLSSFSAIVLSVYGVESYLQKSNKKLLAAICFVMVAVLLGACIYDMIIYHLHPDKKEFLVSIRNSILPIVLIIGIASVGIVGVVRKSYQKLMMIALIAISVVSGILFAQKYLFFSDRTFTFPKLPVFSYLQKKAGVDRVISFGSGQIEKNFTVAYRLFSPIGYDSFFISRYGELLYASENNGNYTSNIPRADVSLSTNSISGLLSDYFQTRIINLLGVHYFIVKNSDVAKDTAQVFMSVKKVWTDGVYSIYSYSQSFPRVFLADSYTIASTNKDIISKIFNPSVDLRKTIVLEKQPQNFTASKIPLHGTATIVHYQNEKVTIQVETNKESILFLSDTYYPGWNAYIDGKMVSLYRADYTFRSIVVPPGHHTVIFVYSPVSVTMGIFASWLGILGIVLTMCTIYYTKRNT